MVRGWLHRPSGEPRCGLALTHGAGTDCESALIREMAEAMAAAGWLALRYDLPFRQERPTGPPSPAGAERDRAGIRAAAELVRGMAPGKIVCGGHSYGARQTTILAAEDPSLADALLLLAYPLHPPRRPAELRTAHFPNLRTPALFVHGTRDPFGRIEELRAAMELIPAHTELLALERAGHELKPAPAQAAAIAAALGALA
jgi:uncharacterized protein